MGNGDGRTRIDLSHVVEDGMPTYPGLPVPIVCDYLTRERSRTIYAPGTEFQIGVVTLCSNTGTYVDSPFHRYPDGIDLSELPLDRLADLDAVVVDAPEGETLDRSGRLRGDRGAPAGRCSCGPGWHRHWRTAGLRHGPPVPDRRRGASTSSPQARCSSASTRSTSTTRAAASDPCTRRCSPPASRSASTSPTLAPLPSDGFRFSAVPVQMKGMGTFPVRAYATIGA